MFGLSFVLWGHRGCRGSSQDTSVANPPRPPRMVSQNDPWGHFDQPNPAKNQNNSKKQGQSKKLEGDLCLD